MTASDGIARPGRGERIVAIVTAGLICGFLGVVLTIGHGSLLFSGGLQGYIPFAIGAALFSTVVVALGCALFSSTKGAVAITQEIPVVAMATVVTAVAAALPPGAEDQTRLATLMVAAALCTAITGVVTVILGYFSLGGIVRLAPYPVIGGFLAGTGWLIVLGGISLILGVPVSGTELAPFMGPATLPKLAATVVVVAVLVVAQWRSRRAFVVPAAILAAIVVFHIVAAALGATPEMLREEGWLLSLPKSGNLWPPIGLADLDHIDWSALLAGVAGVPVVVVLTVTALLMNSTGIEIASDQDADLDGELRSMGALNVAASAGAGLPGYQSVSLTLLAIKLNAASRWVGLIVAALCLAALTFRGVLFDLMPALVLGSVLVWVGGVLIVDWLVRSYRRLWIWEYLIIVAIFATIVGVSFLTGIVVGLVAAIILFAVQYGRIDIIRHELVGKDYQSSVESSEHRRELLREHGSSILIVRLQGFLFFGTADRLRVRIQERLTAATPSPHPYVVIDFQRVTGLDSSAVLSFTRIGQIAARAGATVVLTHVSGRDRDALVRGGLAPGPRSPFRFEPDLERGLKWCEDALLASVEPDFHAGRVQSLTKLLDMIVKDEGMAERIAPFCTRIETAPGSRLIEQGSASEDIFFIEAGRAAIEMDAGNGETLRLTHVGEGAVVGEVAFYTGEPRTASVIANEGMVVWRFSRDDLKRMEAVAPDAALRFHQGMAAILGRRLTRTNRLARFLAD